MNANTHAGALGGAHGAIRSQGAGGQAWSASSIGAAIALAIGLVASIHLFYSTIFWVHPDLAGGVLSGSLSVELGEAFDDYSLYFPPAERAWYTLATHLSEWSGVRLDLTIIAMTSLSVAFSAGLAYHIRRESVGATSLFLIGSLAALVILPILFKNVYGLREHLVVLGLWPYLVLRLSDPDGTKIGKGTRILVGLWLGATLLFKYLYALIVLLVEVFDAAIQRRPAFLFRIENLISGSIVAFYLFAWLVLDPAQREAIGTVVSAIDANLADPQSNLEQTAIRLTIAAFFLVLGLVYKLPWRVTLIGLALVIGTVAAASIQARWYSHHIYPIAAAYVAWWWMVARDVKWWLLAGLGFIIARPVYGEFVNTMPYQHGVTEIDAAMKEAGISVEGKRVGVLNMNPSPVNQYLAANGGLRWNTSVNNSTVSAELNPIDTPENAGMMAPPVRHDNPAAAVFHDKMLQLWEDAPPDAFILDNSTSWPLQFVTMEWQQVLAEDTRFQAILAQYRPVLQHEGDNLKFTYYERVQ